MVNVNVNVNVKVKVNELKGMQAKKVNRPATRAAGGLLAEK